MDRSGALEDAKGDAMIDIERALSERLHERADAMDVHPDVDAAIDGRTVVIVTPPAVGSRRRLLVALAAAVLVALLAAGLLGLDRWRSTPSDQPHRRVPTN